MKYSLRSFASAHWLALAAAMGLAGCLGNGSSSSGPSTPIGSSSTTNTGSGSGSSTAPAPTTTNVTISWAAPTENTDGSALTNLNGFKIYYGTASKQYTNSIVLSNPGLLTYVIDALTIGTTYYFAVIAVSSAGVESTYSPEASATIT
jgi:hypothetical protein